MMWRENGNYNSSLKEARKVLIKLARLFPAIVFAIAFLACSMPAWAQISPDEILNPRAKALEQTYLPRLVSFNRAIQSLRFPFPFEVRRYVGLTRKQDPAPDTRGLQFLHFHNQVILKISGDYQAAYNAAMLSRNQRAARTFEEVVAPILRILPRELPSSIPCDGVGIEISYHVRSGSGAYDFEGTEDMVVLLSKSDAFAFAKVPDKTGWQQVLNHSRIYVDQEQLGLALGERDAIPLEALDDSPSENSSEPPAPKAQTGVSSSGTSDQLVELDRELSLKSATPALEIQAPPLSVAQIVTSAPSAPAPSATEADAARLQARYQVQLNDLAKDGAPQMHFVSYAPPAFVLFQNHIYLQVTLRNPQPFDPQSSSIYKRAAQSFDLFLAPQLKALISHVPSDPGLEGLDITVLNELGAKPGSSSEAAEFVFPISPLKQFVNAEITNQDLINQSIVLVNGVRIALNLQQVE